LAAYKTILIAGPTASGKSGLAIELAKRYNGVIINSDSMQVYSDLPVVTARPAVEEEAEVPHRLYGRVDAAEAFSTGAWLRAVSNLLPDLRTKFETLIFVGGTGLYFNALTQGLSEIPETPDWLRQSLRRELEALGPHQLYAQLRAEDPLSAASLSATDGQRIVRALEVFRHTGRPLLEWQREKSVPLVNIGLSETSAMVLDPDRQLLAEKIRQRFAAMIAKGALEEVSALLSRNLDSELPAMKAIGVTELGAHLAGKVTLEEAVELAVIASRQYAKRQRTWFRGQMDEKWLRIDNSNAVL
jgi:tRNA dimethylallyltransferase